MVGDVKYLSLHSRPHNNTDIDELTVRLNIRQLSVEFVVYFYGSYTSFTLLALLDSPSGASYKMAAKGSGANHRIEMKTVTIIHYTEIIYSLRSGSSDSDFLFILVPETHLYQIGNILSCA